jgi:hypothetical protein
MRKINSGGFCRFSATSSFGCGIGIEPMTSLEIPEHPIGEFQLSHYSAASPFASIIGMSKLPISGMALPAMP